VRPLLIGERANREADSREWTPEAWARVALRQVAFGEGDAAKLARVGVDLSVCDRLNLCPSAPQSEPWNGRFARDVARRLAPRLARRSVVYAAGGRAAAALGVCREGNPLSEVYGHRLTTASGLSVVVLPHLSGLNCWWNNSRRASRLRDLISDLSLETACRRS